MEHADVTVDLCRGCLISEVCIIDFVTLFKCQIKRGTVQHLRHLEGGERVVVGDIMLQAPVDYRAQ